MNHLKAFIESAERFLLSSHPSPPSKGASHLSPHLISITSHLFANAHGIFIHFARCCEIDVHSLDNDGDILLLTTLLGSTLYPQNICSFMRFIFLYSARIIYSFEKGAPHSIQLIFRPQRARYASASPNSRKQSLGNKHLFDYGKLPQRASL